MKINKKRMFNISSSKPPRTLTRVEREEEIVDMIPEESLQDFRKFILREMLAKLAEDGTFEFTEKEKEGEICNKVFLVNLALHKAELPESTSGKKVTVFRAYVKEGTIDDTWEELL